MKRFLAFAALVSLVLIAGCDPFGTDETKCYVTGYIYTDADQTIPAEGIMVMSRGDSLNTFDQSTYTDANGMFLIQVEIYPSPGEEGTGYTLPEFAKIGLEAWHQGASYVYADLDSDPFYIQLGDTLVVWPVDLETEWF